MNQFARNGLAMIICGWVSWIYAHQAGMMLARHIPAIGIDPWVSFIAGALVVFATGTLVYHRVLYRVIDRPLIAKVSETPIENEGWHICAWVHTPRFAKGLHTLVALSLNVPVLHYLYYGIPGFCFWRRC